VVITFLPGNFLALFLSNSSTLLLLFVLRLNSGNLLAILFSGVASHLLVLSVALVLVFGAALLSRDILAVLLGNFIANLVRDLLAHLLRLTVALLLRYNGRHWLLDILAFLHWDRAAEWFVGDRANFISNIISVGNRFGVAILLGNLLTFLLGHLLTLLSGLIPTLLPRFIPALLVAIYI